MFWCWVHQFGTQASLHPDHDCDLSRTRSRAHVQCGGYGANDPARDVPRQARRHILISCRPFITSFDRRHQAPAFCLRDLELTLCIQVHFIQRWLSSDFQGRGPSFSPHLFASKVQASSDAIGHPSGSTVHLSGLQPY
jgi:hypothetical protein